MNWITENIEITISIVGVIFMIAKYIVAKTKNKTDDAIIKFIEEPIMNFLKSLKKTDKKVDKIEPTETEVK